MLMGKGITKRVGGLGTGDEGFECLRVTGTDPFHCGEYRRCDNCRAVHDSCMRDIVKIESMGSGGVHQSGRLRGARPTAGDARRSRSGGKTVPDFGGYRVSGPRASYPDRIE